MADQRAGTAVLAAVTAAAHLVLGLAMRAPIIHPDELGYLSVARFLAGEGLAPQTQYYPAYSALLAPIVWVTSSPLAHWRGALVVNALLAGATVVLAAALARRLAPDLGEGRRLLVVGCLGVYPAFVLWSNLAIAENLLVPLFLGTVLLTWRALEAGSGWRWLAAGTAAGSVYAAHPRGIVVPLALLGVAGMTLRPLREHGASLGALAGGAGAVTVTAWAAAAWVSREAPASARVNDVSGTITKNLSPRMLVNLGAEVAGQVWYLTVTTWGLFPLGMLALLGSLRALVTGRRRDPAGAALSFVALSVVGSVAIGSLFINNDVRIDYLIYGRYNEGVLLPVALLGLLGLVQALGRPGARAWEVLRRPALVVAGALAVSAGALVAGRGAATFDLPVVRTNVFGLDALLVWQDLTLPVVLFTAVALAGALVVLAAARAAPLLSGVAAALLFVPSILTGLDFMTAGSESRDHQRVVASAIGAIEQRTGTSIDCVGYDLATVSGWHEANYRLFLPGVRLQPFRSRRQQAPCSGLAVSGRRDFAADYPGSQPVMFENGFAQTLWALPGPLLDQLTDLGWILPGPAPTPLPVESRRYRLAPAGDRRPPRVAAMRQGDRDKITLRLTHAGQGPGWPNIEGWQSLDQSVRVGVRWYRIGAPGIPDGLVTSEWSRVDLPVTLLPGQSTTLRVPLIATFRDGTPLPVGTYEARVAVLQEYVDWFEDPRNRPFVIEVVVVSPRF